MKIEHVHQALAAARAIVFDFDGTLVDSNEIKWSGFEHVFAEYAEKMPEISRYCRGSNHTIRGEKFRYVTEQILGKEYTDEIAESLHARYAAYTTDAVSRAPEIPGASDFVRQLGSERTALLSSTPHAILLEILERRGWKEFFGRIQGAPIVKRHWLDKLRKTLGCATREIIFFGDTEEDRIAGEQSGCTFVRVGGPGLPNFFI